jgi:hypothetical protein
MPFLTAQGCYPESEGVLGNLQPFGAVFGNE